MNTGVGSPAASFPWVRSYLAALGAFLAADAVWLGLIARRFYLGRLGDLVADPIVWPPAVVFYLLFISGLAYFVVAPAWRTGRPRALLRRAAFFGLCCYATYDLTNWATVRAWPWPVAVVDLVWGAVVSVVAAAAGYAAAGRAPPAAGDPAS